MNGRIIVDTNIILAFLRGDVNVQKFFYDYQPVVSFITELELLSAPQLSPNDKLNIADLLADITVINYTASHKQNVIKIRSGKFLKLPDAIIAALSITTEIPLVSADAAYKKVNGLNLIFYAS